MLVREINRPDSGPGSDVEHVVEGGAGEGREVEFPGEGEGEDVVLHIQAIVFAFVVREKVFSCFVGVVATAILLAVLQYAGGKRGR